MERASGSVMTGIRAFSAHLLSLTSLFYYITILLQLWPSSLLLFGSRPIRANINTYTNTNININTVLSVR